jgi:GAF domain-containing protein
VSAVKEEFGHRYTAALREALGNVGEGSLSAAYDLGRFAVRKGLSVMDLASIHTEAVVAELRSATDASAVERTARASGEFFLESLSAYEMLQRVLRESREIAQAEKRQATLLRQLSGFLGDASLAVDAHASLQEVLHLVAEHAVDVAHADGCSARVESAQGGGAVLEAVAVSDAARVQDAPEAERLADLYAALERTGNAVRLTAEQLAEHLPGSRFAWLAAPFTALDGRRVGLLQLYRRGGDDRFSEVDEAVVVQLAQMASATFERMEPYRR